VGPAHAGTAGGVSVTPQFAAPGMTTTYAIEFTPETPLAKGNSITVDVGQAPGTVLPTDPASYHLEDATTGTAVPSRRRRPGLPSPSSSTCHRRWATPSRS
jgi:hypothetical protein